MRQLTRTPLAWKNLTHSWLRLVVAVAGVAVAVLLMLMQVGFMYALFDSPFKIVDSLNPDLSLFLVSKARYTITIEQRFPRYRLHQAESCPGVGAVYPIYAERTFAILRNLIRDETHKGYPIRVIGVDPDMPLFAAAEMGAQMARLDEPQTALIDRQSKDRIFPFEYEDDSVLREQPAELAGKRINIVGTFSMGTDFVHDGNLVMSAENFARYFPGRPPQGEPLASIDLGVVRVEPGADVQEVRDRLQALFDEDVLVLTRAEYRDKEKEFWSSSTPIGQIFMVGVGIGFIVGLIICYQIIATDIADHMPEFATLKAMGYSDRYFQGLIIAQSFYLSLLGFGIGLGVGLILYRYVSDSTGLPMMITWERAALILALTIAMCLTSGLLALRKLLKADPASLF